MRIICLGVLLSLFVQDSFANETDNAEYRRLSMDMEKMSQRQVWAGVEKKFLQLKQLNKKIEYEHYLIAAQASQELGNMEQVRLRLRSALEIKRKRKIITWLNGIEEHYGSVYLKASSKGDAKLVALQMPIDPVQVNAIKSAQRKLAKDRKFNGLLPRGEYTFIQHPFTIEPGVDIKLEISPKQRKKGLIAPRITKPDATNYDDD